MPDVQNRRALLDPLRLVLRSRRVVIALCALLVGVLVLAVPPLAALRGELLTLLTALALALIGGFSLEDAARAARELPPAPLPTPDDLRPLVRDLLDSVLDELIERKGLPVRDE